MQNTFRPRGRPRVINTKTAEERRLERKARRTERATAEAERLPNLPDGARIKRATVELLLGISQTTIWAWIKSGKIPAPEKDGHRVFWPASTVRKLIGECHAQK